MKAAGSHGICRTAKTLRVDYYSLKRRLEQSSAGTQGLSQANFVELPPLAPASLGECTVEWEDAAGSTMRVHLKGFPCAGPGGAGPELLELRAMLQITPQMKILVAVEPADFRRGIDGLAQVCQDASTRPVRRHGLRLPQSPGHGAEDPHV